MMRDPDGAGVAGIAAHSRRASGMRMKILATLGLFALGAVAGHGTPASVLVSASAEGPQMTSIGPLTFGPNGVLFAADTQAATIYALDLGDKASGGAQGAR